MLDGVRNAKLSATALLLSLALLCGSSSGQKATAIPHLDLQRYLSAWYVQTWIPTKAEEHCATNVQVLYAYGDGSNAFQMGTFCQRKNGNTDEWNSAGKLDKKGSGKLKLRRFVLLSSPYWVLDVDPTYEWALVGTPNHKKLWVLTKAAVVAPQLLADIERRAVAQGFNPSKLVKAPHAAAAQ